MIQKFITYSVVTVGMLLLVLFETTIGVPLLYIFFGLRMLQERQDLARLVLCILLSLPLAFSTDSPVTLIFCVLLLATHLAERVKRRTVVQHLTNALLVMLVVVGVSRLQLLPVAFIYVCSVWILVVLQQTVPAKSYKRELQNI